MNRIYRLLQKSTILLAAFSMLVACAPRVTEPPPLPTALVQVTPPEITPTVPEVAIPTTSPIPPTPDQHCSSEQRLDRSSRRRLRVQPGSALLVGGV